MADLGDHVRPTGGTHDPGVYRVVGTTGEVALLYVADASGRRVHTGEVCHVSPETLEAEFEAATDPDAGFTPVADVRNLLSGLYWEVRRFL